MSARRLPAARPPAGLAPGAEVKVFADRDALVRCAAAEVTAALSGAVAAAGRARLVLAGGSTPRDLYCRLASARLRRRVDWRQVEVFFGDERCVPPDDPASNYRMADETLLAAVAPGAVHRIAGERGPEVAARLYDRLLRRSAGETPRFDLVLLGMGADGHTASLFPGDPAPAAPRRRAAGRLALATRAPEPPHDRVSLSFEALAGGRIVLFLVTGAAKAAAVARVMSGDEPLPPAARVRPASGRLVWMLDRAAAGGGPR